MSFRVFLAIVFLLTQLMVKFFLFIRKFYRHLYLMHPVKFTASHSICNKSTFLGFSDFYGRMILERVVKHTVFQHLNKRIYKRRKNEHNFFILLFQIILWYWQHIVIWQTEKNPCMGKKIQVNIIIFYAPEQWIYLTIIFISF